MLYTDFTEKLTGLQDLIITEVENTEKEIHIFGKMKRKQFPPRYYRMTNRLTEKNINVS